MLTCWLAKAQFGCLTFRAGACSQRYFSIHNLCSSSNSKRVLHVAWLHSMLLLLLVFWTRPTRTQTRGAGVRVGGGGQVGVVKHLACGDIIGVLCILTYGRLLFAYARTRTPPPTEATRYGARIVRTTATVAAAAAMAAAAGARLVRRRRARRFSGITFARLKLA